MLKLGLTQKWIVQNTISPPQVDQQSHGYTGFEHYTMITKSVFKTKEEKREREREGERGEGEGWRERQN